MRRDISLPHFELHSIVASSQKLQKFRIIHRSIHRFPGAYRDDEEDIGDEFRREKKKKKGKKSVRLD